MKLDPRDPCLNKHMESFSISCSLNTLSMMVDMLHPYDVGAQVSMIEHMVDHWKKWQKNVTRDYAKMHIDREIAITGLCHQYANLKAKEASGECLSMSEEKSLAQMAEVIAKLPKPEDMSSAEDIYCHELRAIEMVADMAKSTLLARLKRDDGPPGTQLTGK